MAVTRCLRVYGDSRQVGKRSVLVLANIALVQGYTDRPGGLGGLGLLEPLSVGPYTF